MTNEVALSKFGFISIFPEMISALSDWGVTGRALREGRYSVDTIDPLTGTGQWMTDRMVVAPAWS